MERLTRTSDSGEVAFTFNLYINCLPSEANKILNVATKLKEYEDLEEQGMLIKLPFKMGDTVYEITGATTRGYDWKHLTYEKAYVHVTVFNLGRLNDIGKTVFLTKSEAEAKLKELRGVENE